ncbi:hypothetical protein ACEN2P_03585 [Pedobacter psychrotolerans]|uniref:hypothetical protein n=1 Tax=Pedobacter psychrotolerans TaxID=1843235 RepID=UPI003F9AFEB1
MITTTGSEQFYPKKGEIHRTSYKLETGVIMDGGNIVYQGCIKEIPRYTSIKGKMISREFYVNDYSSPEFNAPEFHSTLFWKPDLKLFANKPMELLFTQVISNLIIKYQYRG